MFSMKKMSVATAMAAVTLCYLAPAMSATLSGEGVIASTDVTFTAPAVITNSLKPVSGLIAGDFKDGTQIADGTVHALDSAPHRYAVTFSKDIETTPGGFPMNTVTGQNDSSHKLVLWIKNATGNSVEMMHAIIDGTPYAVSMPNARTFPYNVMIDNDQTVPADTYTVSTAAYVYNS